MKYINPYIVITLISYIFYLITNIRYLMFIPYVISFVALFKGITKQDEKYILTFLLLGIITRFIFN